MAKVRLTRQTDSPFWYADFEAWDGVRQKMVRRFKSTGKTNKREAQAVADAIASAAQAVARMASGHDRLDAHDLVRELLDSAGLPSLGAVETWETFTRRWLSLWTLKPQSRAVYDGRLADFAEYLGPRVKSPMQMISAADIQGWYQMRMKSLGPTTVHTRLGFLRRLFQRAYLERVVDRNPVDLVVRNQARVVKRSAFTREEIQKLMGYLESTQDQEWATMLMLGLCLGARLQDCAQMTFEHYDPVAQTFTWRPMKTPERVQTVPVVEPLLSWVKALLAQRKSGPLCPRLVGMSGASLSNQFAKRLTTVGIGQDARACGARRLKQRSFHCLRHTLPSWLLAAGVDERTSMAIVGHHSKEVHQGYTHAEMDAMRAAMVKGMQRLTSG